ncbi:MAG: DMT family transporter [Roseiarcus sp.]|jgi:drug/metabolite transporter (DMT)-like permease
MSAARPANSPATYAMLVAAAVIYGAIFTVNKLAAAGGVPPLAYSFWQSFGAGLVLWLVLTFNGERIGVSRQHLVSYIVVGALVIGIPITLLTYIAPKLPAGVMTLVLALSPPFTFMLSVLGRLERFRVMGLFGLLCGFIGVVVVVAPGATLGSPDAWKWFLLALAAPLMFASSNVAAAVLRPPAASSAAMGAGVLFGSSLVLLPVMLITGQEWFPRTFDDGAIATLIAIAINAAFLVLFLEIIRRAGPTFFAQFNYLAVLAGIAWGAIVFGERLTFAFFVAMVLMFAGVFLSGYRRDAA